MWRNLGDFIRGPTSTPTANSCAASTHLGRVHQRAMNFMTGSAPFVIQTSSNFSRIALRRALVLEPCWAMSAPCHVCATFSYKPYIAASRLPPLSESLTIPAPPPPCPTASPKKLLKKTTLSHHIFIFPPHSATNQRKSTTATPASKVAYSSPVLTLRYHPPSPPTPRLLPPPMPNPS